MTAVGSARDLLDRRVRERQDAGAAFFGPQAPRLASLCHRMAERFARGGRLIALGTAPAARSDARHVEVEFVHPVIVGKRALPAIALTTDVATVTGIAERDGVAEIFAHQIRCLASPRDIALGIASDDGSPSVREGLRAAHDLGLLTIALAGGSTGSGLAADHVLLAASDDPRVVKETHVTMYHVLWELVHVFFEQPGVLS